MHAETHQSQSRPVLQVLPTIHELVDGITFQKHSIAGEVRVYDLGRGLCAQVDRHSRVAGDSELRDRLGQIKNQLHGETLYGHVSGRAEDAWAAELARRNEAQECSICGGQMPFLARLKGWRLVSGLLYCSDHWRAEKERHTRLLDELKPAQTEHQQLFMSYRMDSRKGVQVQYQSKTHEELVSTAAQLFWDRVNEAPYWHALSTPEKRRVRKSLGLR